MDRDGPGWINASLEAEAAARVGDPGPVTSRRLSNSEYDDAIRDLTGVDMRLTRTREFPTDCVGGEGFANIGDAMPVTPELVERCWEDERRVVARERFHKVTVAKRKSFQITCGELFHDWFR